jgi:hypothetical protein
MHFRVLTEEVLFVVCPNRTVRGYANVAGGRSGMDNSTGGDEVARGEAAV